MGWRRKTLLVLGFFLGMVLEAGAASTLLLATTTSTQDSGLLDVLLPAFERRTGIHVKTIAVGSGQALALGGRGEADVLLVHSPEAEQAFLAQGHGRNRKKVMYNDFILVGPAGALSGASSAGDAFRRIQQRGLLFVSRGDQSGTHALELKLWRAVGTQPDGKPWYQQTGLGMGQTLNVAAEKRGITLTDRATFLATGRRTGLQILFQNDPALFNVYHVMEIDPARHPKVNAAGAASFAHFILSPEGQGIIGTFGKEKFGTPLFVPSKD
jgi:tungstate transport system substrate-binding protein